MQLHKHIGASIFVFCAVIVAGVFAFPYVASIEAVVHTIIEPKPSPHFLFVGDMMFDRQIRHVGENKGYNFLFSCIDKKLKGFDDVIGNLEGPITSTSSQSVGSVIGVPDNYIFTFSPLVAPLLKGHNVDIVNIGNNHTLNFGRDGLVQTKKFLTDAGVLYFGDPDVTESDRVLRTSVNGVSISFVNWSDWTSDNTDITGNQIKSEVASGRTVVVYTHWGQEYVPVIERVRALAHQFIDDGASIVIGSHPHIVQEHEVYKGRHIYYSLGNFIFDQYWNAEVSHGLTLDTTLTESGVVEIREFPVELLPDGRTCFVEK